jgi:hypothetical protein
VGETYHVTKKAEGQWAVARSGARRASSTHRTEAEAIAAGQRLAVKGGGGEVVVHGSDGRLRQSDQQQPSPRAPRSEGPRTTLRVPDELAASADRLAEELGISRNDALLRLATRGARIYELEHSIALRRAERWAAVVPGDVDLDFPAPEEARAAILAGVGGDDAVTPSA